MDLAESSVSSPSSSASWSYRRAPAEWDRDLPAAELWAAACRRFRARAAVLCCADTASCGCVTGSDFSREDMFSKDTGCSFGLGICTSAGQLPLKPQAVFPDLTTSLAAALSLVQLLGKDTCQSFECLSEKLQKPRGSPVSQPIILVPAAASIN